MNAYKQSFWASIALRWGVSSLGLWIASGLFSDSVNIENKLGAVLVAGAVLAVLYDPLHIAGFGTAMITGLVIGLVNYLVTAIIDT